MSKKIGIVYFVYINQKKDWRKIISGQLKDVAATGILNDADLYLEVSAPAENSEINRFFEDLPYSIASIDMHYENAYEYFGIHKVWELGNSNKYEYLIYFHTKGMSYRNRYPLPIWNRRSLREVILTYYTFKNYLSTIRYFEENPGVMKIGAFPNNTDTDKHGCIIWFNFFWIRSSYVKELVEPIKTKDRFYYEYWISFVKSNGKENFRDKCYSVFSWSVEGYDQTQASDKLKNLRRIYKYTWPISYLYRKFGSC